MRWGFLIFAAIGIASAIFLVTKWAEHNRRDDFVFEANCVQDTDLSGKPLGPMRCQAPRDGTASRPIGSAAR